MKIILFTFLLMISFFSSLANANELSAAQRLRKLSIQLRGQDPSASEYEDLKQTSNTEAFFSKKANEYIGDSAHVEKMEQRLLELFRLKIKNGPYIKHSRSSYGLSDSSNALNHLFRNIVSSNLSWDELLVSKSYKTFNVSSNNQFSEWGFLKKTFPEQLPETADGVITKGTSLMNDESDGVDYWREVIAKTEVQKQVTAGSITTGRFFERYPTTKLNKNRKRAAAIFRIFLCDDMRPVVLENAEDDAQLLAASLGQNMKTEVHSTEAQEKRHGTDAQCMSCHYKLDPMADTFRTSGLVLSPWPAAGKLVYTQDNGKQVNVGVKGIGGLGEAIAQQPAYAQCQVKHFWEWFIGKDVSLPEKRLLQLTSEFDRLGRRPNDFIEYLVQQPEYKVIPTTGHQEITITNVKPILQKCDQCHGKQNIPMFSILPIKNSDYNHSGWLKQISEHLDLKNNGRDADMPPKNAGWELTENERDLIGRWLLDGAKDDRGEQTITEAQATTLVSALTKNIPTELEPTFENTFYRYIVNHDIFLLLDQYFGAYDNSIEFRCISIDAADKNTIGVVSPIDGRVIFKSPMPAFVSWLHKCATMYVNAHFEANPSKDEYSNHLKGSFVFLDKETRELLSALPAAGKDKSLVQLLPWHLLSPEHKQTVVRKILNQLVPEYRLGTIAFNQKVAMTLATIEAYIQKTKATSKEVVSVKMVAKWASVLTLMSSEFLTY
jgi:hypothetical protein